MLPVTQGPRLSTISRVRPTQEGPDGEGRGHCQASRKSAPATCEHVGQDLSARPGPLLGCNISS